MKMRSLVCVFLTVLSAAPMARGQEQETGEAVVIYSAGIEAMLPSPKDAALRRALELLDDRLAELPQELNQPDVPLETIGPLLDLLLRPMTIRAGLLEDAGDAQLPFYAQLAISEGRGQQAQEEARRLLEMISAAGVPAEPREVPGQPGVRSFDANGVPAFLGSMNNGDGRVIVAAINRLMDPDLSPPSVKMPEGVEPVLAVRVEGRKLASLLDAVIAHAPAQEAEMMRLQMSMYGLTGETPMGLEMGYGYDGGVACSVLRYVNYLSSPMTRQVIVREPLRPKDMALIPVDAVYAQVSRVDLSKYPDLIREAFKASGPALEQAPGVDQAMQMFADMTGVHPEQDLFAHLGTAMGYYTAQSTGGGGLGSFVSFVELKNPADFATSLDMLATFLNQLARDQARGYVRIQPREMNGHEIVTLSFPGLPVPLEPSWTVHRDYLLAAATPQALMAAMDQAEEGGSDLRQAEGFKRSGQGRVEQAMSVAYLDTKALATRGYGVASLGMSAMANALQSPQGKEGRDPGLIMPTYSALMEDVQPSLTVYRLEGEDLVIEGRSDGSMLVNLSSVAGLMSDAPTAVAIGSVMAGVLPALGKARSSARGAQGSAQLRQIGVGIVMYEGEHNDKFPGSLQALVEGGYLTEEMLTSSYGPVHDDGGDYWLNTHVEQVARVDDPARYVISYDRASYASGEGTVLVLFGDSHVEAVDMGTFFELMESPQHEGIDFNLPEW